MYTLYYMPACPYCQKVLSFAQENNIELTLKDIHEGENESELVARGGKKTVPYLVDDASGQEMYESMDIIQYLKTKI
jgi:glutaredoxin 3